MFLPFLFVILKNYKCESGITPGGSPLEMSRYLSIKTARRRGDSLEKDLLIYFFQCLSFG